MTKKLRCLVSEDNQGVREVIALALVSEGWEVFSAENGRDALRIYHDAIAGYEVITNDGVQELRACDASYFDLILSDVVMPRLNGYAVGMSIRVLEKYGDAPRSVQIYLTGHADAVPPEDLLASSDVDGYIKKPLDTRELINQIDKLMKSAGEAKTKRR